MSESQQFPATVTVTGLGEAVDALLREATSGSEWFLGAVAVAVGDMDLSARAAEQARETAEEVLNEHAEEQEHLDRDEVEAIAESTVEDYLANNYNALDEDAVKSIAAQVVHDEMCWLIARITEALEAR